MSLDHGISTIAELMEGLLSEYITLAANNCFYLGNTKEMIVNWIHPLFL